MNAEALDSMVRRASWVIEEYREEFPELHLNYTLIGLLYLEEFDRVYLSPSIKARAAQGKITNLASLHRAISLAKKGFLTPQDAFTLSEREDAFREALATWEGH